jgi:hypothetical protein
LLWTRESESKGESDLLWGRESESKEESDLLWTPESESKEEPDLVWTPESESKEESDLARHLLTSRKTDLLVLFIRMSYFDHKSNIGTKTKRMKGPQVSRQRYRAAL